MKPSNLLSLPKELRLEIWKYTVTDPSMDEVILRIDRDYLPYSKIENPPKYDCDFQHQYTRFHSLVKAILEKPRNCQISVELLRCSRLIYHEALPLLYHSVTFLPWTASMFPEFLSSLSDFAKQHIRRIRLCIDAYSQPACHFSWTMLCAQTASLPCLRQVEVLSSCVHRPPPSRFKERVLRPLLKIKAPKKLVPETDDEFQRLLVETRQEMEAEKAARRHRAKFTAAEAMARKQADVDQSFGLSEKNSATRFEPFFEIDEQATNIKDDAEEELEERQSEDWEVVSMHNLESDNDRGPPELVPHMKRSRPQLDSAQSVPSRYHDWELVDPAELCGLAK